MTINELITSTQVRRRFGDPVEPYRFDDTVLLAYWNAGRRNLVGRHPEAAYVDGIVVTDEIADADNLDEDVKITPVWYNAMMNWLAASVLMEDMENPGNAQTGATFMQLYEAEVG